MSGDNRLVLQMNKSIHNDLLDNISYSNITPWELEFLDDIGRALHNHTMLSKNQETTLRQIHSKYCHRSTFELEAEAHATMEDQR